MMISTDFILKGSELANFAEMSKVAVMLIKTTFRKAVNVKKLCKIY